MTSNFFQPAAALPREARRFWWLAAAAGAAYAVSLRGAPYPDQAVAKVFLCVMLLFAALYHREHRERVWLCAALIFSGAGDVLLALPGMAQGFVLGLGAFLLAHLAYFVLFWRVRRRWSQVPAWHRVAIVLVWITAALAYVMYWPGMGELKAPVACYVIVLAMMASAALLANVGGGMGRRRCIALHRLGCVDRHHPLRRQRARAGIRHLDSLRVGAVVANGRHLGQTPEW